MSDSMTDGHAGTDGATAQDATAGMAVIKTSPRHPSASGRALEALVRRLDRRAPARLHDLRSMPLPPAGLAPERYGPEVANLIATVARARVVLISVPIH